MVDWAPLLFDEMGNDKGGKKASRRQDPVVTWAANHTPFLATLIFFSFLVIRVLRVASFDPATATTLVRESGPVTVAVGVLVTSFPPLLLGAAAMLVFFSHGGPGADVQRRAALTAVMIIVLVLTVLLPWSNLLVALAVLTGLFLLQRRLRWRLEIFAVIGLAVSTLLDVPRVWLPPEVIVSSGGEQTVGYVLQGDPEWTTILEEEDRSIDIVETSSIDSRRVCNLDREGTARTISQIILGEEGGPRNPHCTELLQESAGPV